MAHLHPRAAVLEPVHAGARDEPEEHIGTAVLMLRVRCLEAELVRVRPGGAAHRALLVREPGEEPVVRAVPVVDLERHEQAAAEGDRGEDRTATEGRYANADALQSVRVVGGEMGTAGLTIKPKPAWKYGLCLVG